MAVSIYIPDNSVQGFSFLHILSSTYIFMMIAILTAARWYLIMVSTFIPLAICDVEHLHMYSLASHVTSFEKCLFRSFACF